jgi:hypothetical protein
MGKSGYMRLVQDHFANEITKWNEGILEYLPRPLSTASADESYYKNMIVQMLGADKKAFAFEISDMGEQSKSFRYHGFYCVHAWRNHEGRAIERPGLPMDWNVRELTARVKQVLQ